MTDPRNQDDSWGELYRELGVDDPEPSKPAPVREEAEPDDEPEVIELIESETDEIGEPAQAFDEAGEDELVESAEGEGELADGGAAEGEGEPGQKKRRRRRRRRKKKGAAGQSAGEEAAGFDEGEGEESETQLDSDEEETEAVIGPGVEEEVTPEMTRDIISNWNVPSWEEIVAGLHRPDR
ncbi:MAG TPA: hypothetical protein VM533_09725 [Fimbriiglobus sp.]|jgi:hypothetical protein|nr:hypothetical protein [Fimbriiglobus sp.]